MSNFHQKTGSKTFIFISVSSTLIHSLFLKNRLHSLVNFQPASTSRYLAEFCYRHNRRFQLDQTLPRFAYMAVRTPPMPVRLLKLAEDYG
jgi:hypothetical protein